MKGFFLTEWAFLGMRWLYEQFENLVGEGSASVFLTVLLATLMIKALTLFSDIKSRKSSLKMQQVQPDLDKIKKKYANDPQRMNLEQRKLMKERGVSMMGGCLPMLFTLPLFFIFISAFRSWSNEQALRLVVEAENDPKAAVETMEGNKFLWVNNVWRPDSFDLFYAMGFSSEPGAQYMPVMSGEMFYSQYSGKTEDYYLYEEEPELKETLTEWGFFDDKDKFIATYNEKMAPVMEVYEPEEGKIQFNGFGILAVIAAVTTFLSQWIMQKSQPKQADGKGQGKFIMYIFPVMTLFFCWQYDTTFALYWIFSNIIATGIGLVLNKWIKKKYGSPNGNQVEVIK